MSLQSKYAFMIKSVVLFARDESEMPHATERSRNYLVARIARFHDLLERRDEIGPDDLKSAYNLISNISAAYDESYDHDHRGTALYRAVLRDLKDELDAAIQA